MLLTLVKLCGIVFETCRYNKVTEKYLPTIFLIFETLFVGVFLK